jgi:plasmid stabilization system protein ParE
VPRDALQRADAAMHAHEAAVQRTRAEGDAAHEARVASETEQRTTAARLESALSVRRKHGILSAPGNNAVHAASEAALPPQLAGGMQQQPDVPASKSRPADAPRFKGVTWNKKQKQWQVKVWDSALKQQLHVGGFAVGAEVEAAHAYDAAVRAAGGSAVNFPRAGTAETQAHAAPRVPPVADRCMAASNLRPADAPRFKGVTWNKQQKQWQVRLWDLALKQHMQVGTFAVGAEVEAAHAYDAAVRAAGGFEVNFPRAGTAETQAHAAPRVPPVADLGVPASKSRPADAPRFKGVIWNKKLEQWQVQVWDSALKQPMHVGWFAVGAEVEAAHAYDAAVRAAGGTAVNFPRAGTAETQAHAALRVPPVADHGMAAPKSRPTDAPRFKGVFWHKQMQLWYVQVRDSPTTRRTIGWFAVGAEVEAAHAYDAAVRAAGGTAVNFPRAGTAETQARDAPRELPASGFRGVQSRGSRFEARVQKDGRGRTLWKGIFDTAEQAARARDRFLRDAGAPLEQLSFPDATDETTHEPPPAGAAPTEGGGSAARRRLHGDDDADDGGRRLRRRTER